mgnify:CR=1 FL=1
MGVEHISGTETGPEMLGTPTPRGRSLPAFPLRATQEQRAGHRDGRDDRRDNGTDGPNAEQAPRHETGAPGFGLAALHRSTENSPRPEYGTTTRTRACHQGHGHARPTTSPAAAHRPTSAGHAETGSENDAAAAPDSRKRNMPSATERATAAQLLRRPFVKDDEVTGQADAEATTQATRDGARDIVDPEFAGRTVLHALGEGSTEIGRAHV